MVVQVKVARPTRGQSGRLSLIALFTNKVTPTGNCTAFFRLIREYVASSASPSPCSSHPLASPPPAIPAAHGPALAGPPYSNVRQQLFHSSHLPPPSQLHLPPVSSSRSNINTPPPLNPSSRMSPYSTHRHPSPPPPPPPTWSPRCLGTIQNVSVW